MEEPAVSAQRERPDGLRPILLERGCNAYAEGSCLVRWGQTAVLCTATVEDRVPPFLRGSGQGWVTAEYALLPRSTATRTPRDAVKGRINGRSQEIQRLIGRSLRSAVDLKALGERTVTLDCDVLQADGGTRTASITGAFVALVEALRTLRDRGQLDHLPLKGALAAVSVGKVEGQILLDLCYDEDHRAEVDFNVVMNGQGHFVEVQGTGEGGTFSRDELGQMLDLAAVGIGQIMEIQKKALEWSEEEVFFRDPDW